MSSLEVEIPLVPSRRRVLNLSLSVKHTLSRSLTHALSLSLTCSLALSHTRSKCISFLFPAQLGHV